MNWRLPNSNQGRRHLATLLFVGIYLLVVGALIFREFLFGGSVLLYKDVGRDSLDDYYPWFVHFSDYARQYGFPSWSFSIGMGQDILYLAGYFFWEPVVWLPRALIAHALVYQHLLKTIAAGLLFFSFLRLYRIEFVSSLLGSLLLAFSAYMCMGACWFVLADEVVGFTTVLFATEWALHRGKWQWLTLTVAAIGLISAFHFYLCALLLSFYVPARLWINGKTWRNGWATLLTLAAAAVLGVGLSAAVALPNLVTMLNSPRGSGTASVARFLESFPIFGFESPAHYQTVALRFFGNDLLGGGEQYHGWQNYFEAPIVYCGLLSALLFPQALVVLRTRARIICALFLIVALVPVVFPWFRYLLWAFQDDYYRTYGLFSTIAVIVMAMMVLSHFAQGGRVNVPLLAATTITSIIILHLPAMVNISLARNATLFLIGYAVLLVAAQLFRRQQFATWCVLVLSTIELIRFDFVTVSDRDKITASELQQRVGYNDDTIDALRHIKMTDGNFFRITKLQPAYSDSYGYNDAMVFGYYGTAAYNSFNNGNYIDFLWGVNAIPANYEPDTRWCPGVTNDLLLSIFTCEKYRLAEDATMLRDSPAYEFVAQYQHQALFRNVAWVPLGLIFDRYLPEDLFLKLPTPQKRFVLLRAVVVKNKEQAEKLGLSQIPSPEEEITDSSLSDVVLALRKSAFKLTSFRPFEITGNLQLARKAVMVVQTPFDEGWRPSQDNRAVKVLPVDAGLLGVALDPGEHRVVLRYRNRYLPAGIILSVSSLICLGLGMRFSPRIDP